jgi:hypothetical protein
MIRYYVLCLRRMQRGALSLDVVKSQSVLHLYSSVLYLMRITSRRAPLFKCTIPLLFTKSLSLLIMLDTAGVIPDIPHTAEQYETCIFKGFFFANVLCLQPVCTKWIDILQCSTIVRFIFHLLIRWSSLFCKQFCYNFNVFQFW